MLEKINWGKKQQPLQLRMGCLWGLQWSVAPLGPETHSWRGHSQNYLRHTLRDLHFPNSSQEDKGEAQAHPIKN